MHLPRGLFRRAATAAILVGIAVSMGPVAQAQPDDGYADPDWASMDPLPSPSGDLRGKKPLADTLPPPPESPYPDDVLILTSYDGRAPSEFFTASNEGVWFTTPLGLNCGIWDRGSFGCKGHIPGAPPNTSRIGWVSGNIVVRYDAFDPLLRFQFPGGVGERTLPPRSYVEYNGTRCATMADNSTYCARGTFKFFVTPTKTYLSPP